MKCQACKLKNANLEAIKHPSHTSQWNAEYAKKMLSVKKYRCQEHSA